VLRAALAAAVLLGLAAAPAQAFKLTHKITVSGRLVDQWTIDEPGSCNPVGGGTTTLEFGTRRPLRARPTLHPTYSGKVGSRHGSWGMLVVGPDGHIIDMPPRVGRATLTRDDQTQQHPSEFDEPCDPPDRTGCGAQTLKRPLLAVKGYDRRHIYVDLKSPRWDVLPCFKGGLDLFSIPAAMAGGTADGTLRVRMPRPSKLRQRRVVTVKGSSHKRTAFGDAESGATTDDVTRTVTVTFTRLR
jgi:hypothetical protein